MLHIKKVFVRFDENKFVRKYQLIDECDDAENVNVILFEAMDLMLIYDTAYKNINCIFEINVKIALKEENIERVRFVKDIANKHYDNIETLDNEVNILKQEEEDYGERTVFYYNNYSEAGFSAAEIYELIDSWGDNKQEDFNSQDDLKEFYDNPIPPNERAEEFTTYPFVDEKDWGYKPSDIADPFAEE